VVTIESSVRPGLGTEKGTGDNRHQGRGGHRASGGSSKVSFGPAAATERENFLF
jgi:hypothetical protein